MKTSVIYVTILTILSLTTVAYATNTELYPDPIDYLGKPIHGGAFMVDVVKCDEPQHLSTSVWMCENDAMQLLIKTDKGILSKIWLKYRDDKQYHLMRTVVEKYTDLIAMDDRFSVYKISYMYIVVIDADQQIIFVHKNYWGK